jgi:CubicO group peptidase (beta-lactamase class C family)
MTAIDAIVNAHVDPRGPGAAVAIIHDGAVIHSKGYGLANLEWVEPIAPDTVFRIGSTTKLFTATAILLLEAEGKLALADAIRRHLPEMPAAYEPITLRYLLTHTSGIPNYVTRPGFWEDVATRDHSFEELMDLFKDLPLDFAPGTDYSYSNSAYALLGLLIERHSGSSYGEFIRTRIFEPLGMARSRYMWHDEIIPRRAAGYKRIHERIHERIGEGYTNARYISPTLLSAGGGLGSTLDDVVRWDTALRAHTLLDAATLERMWMPVRLENGQARGYGLGWGLSTYRGRRVVHHAGGVPGFSAFYGRFVGDELSVIVLSNLAGFDAAGLATEISNLVLDLPEPTRVPTSIGSEALVRVAGTYSNIIGETLVARPDGDGLAVSGTLTHRFLPTSATIFYAADHPDIELRFEDPQGDGLGQVTAIIPFYWFVATQMHEPQ